MGEDIGVLGDEAIKVLKEYLTGSDIQAEKARTASRVLAMAIRVQHMKEHSELVRRGQVIRLLPWLDNAQEVKDYIAATQPQMRLTLPNKPLGESG